MLASLDEHFFDYNWKANGKYQRRQDRRRLAFNKQIVCCAHVQKESGTACIGNHARRYDRRRDIHWCRPISRLQCDTLIYADLFGQWLITNSLHHRHGIYIWHAVKASVCGSFCGHSAPCHGTVVGCAPWLLRAAIVSYCTRWWRRLGLASAGRRLRNISPRE